jgi:hypothetical protein
MILPLLHIEREISGINHVFCILHACKNTTPCGSQLIRKGLQNQV